MAKKKKELQQDPDEFDYSAISIDGNEATWRINDEGPINGKYLGTFKFRCFLTPSQRIAADRDFREMLGSNPSFAKEHEADLAFALTQLKYRVIAAPPFWDGESEGSLKGDVADDNIISLILAAAVASELKYRRQLAEKKDTAIERAKKAAEAILNNQQKEEKEEDDESENPPNPNQS